MQLHRYVLPAIVLASGAEHVNGAETCKTLLDNDSTLVKSLATAYQEDFSGFPFDTVFSDLHNAVPWFSTCAAAMDPVAVFASMRTSSSFISCVRKVEGANLDNGLWSQEGWNTLCPLLQDTAVPCVKNAMTEIVMDAFDTTNGCCDSFLDQVDTLFSNSLATMVEKLSQYAVNILCSERKFTNLEGQATTEFCGYSIFKSFGFIESEDDIVPLLGLLQLPNGEMCDAFAGKPFKLTNGTEFTIGFGTKGADTMGICVQPIDSLLEYVASWPLFAQTWSANGTSFSPSSLFASGKSLSFATLKSWFDSPSNLPAVVELTLENFAIAVSEFWSARYSTDYYNGYNDTNDGYGYFSGSYSSDDAGDNGFSGSFSSDDFVGDDFDYSESGSGESSDAVDYGYFNYSESGSGETSDDVGYGYDHDYNSGSGSYYGNYYYYYGSYWSSSRDGNSDLSVVLVEQLIADIGTMLLHIPNGGDCTFSSQTITLPFDMSEVSTIDTVAAAVTSAPTVSTTTVSTQSSGAVNLSILSSGVAIVILWGLSWIGL
ncbi:Peroxisomal 2 [Phytophthora cinnamomi]|uniref:Peroxisomal 2 n=1 Tax=Phytophthora cinnamomi TaxID=4785 RepID=UPI0035598DC0|nr:Peroxisomal 2 [Phytophthora cinnamomi]